ncbi:hypothetical protein MES5069_220138 [Mesorhizobium escarrei]|uniref:Uncharacterized protein n=1 Tax=Mesorhizobium escarrei TaxID=666018 RepID=A0ABN8JMP2_9HYPH|nr:hypothetical protein MES5069_220138 [Mesorhizobium escarrei]
MAKLRDLCPISVHAKPTYLGILAIRLDRDRLERSFHLSGLHEHELKVAQPSSLPRLTALRSASGSLEPEPSTILPCSLIGQTHDLATPSILLEASKLRSSVSSNPDTGGLQLARSIADLATRPRNLSELKTKAQREQIADMKA